MTTATVYARCDYCNEIRPLNLTVERRGTTQDEVYECPIHGVIQTNRR